MEVHKNINFENTRENEITKLALQAAINQIGQCENPKGSNSGKMINEYLRSVGLNGGYAWCQAFVYWCFNEAAKKLYVPNPVVKTAGVHDCWNRTPTTQKLLKNNTIKVQGLINLGYQFILIFGMGNGHTGIVEFVDGMNMHTIEGNSNNDGNREGYEVVRHVRRIDDKHLLGFIKY